MPRPKKQPPTRAPRERGEDPADKQLRLGGDDWSVGDLSAKVRKELALQGDDRDVYDDRDATAAATAPSQDDVADGEHEDPQWDGFVDDDEVTTEEDADPEEKTLADDTPELWIEPTPPKSRTRSTEKPTKRTVATSVADDEDEDGDAGKAEEVPDFAAIPEPAPDTTPAAVAKPRKPKAPPRRPEPPARLEMGGWLTFVVIVAVGWAAITAVLLTRPALATRLLSSFAPFADLSDAALTARAIGLSELKAEYQLIRGDPALVVSGVATSAARGSVRDVRVQGRLFGVSGKILAEKEIYAGIALSPEVLSTTDAYGITIVERMQPTERFALAPGDGAPFVIVFVDPPADEPITHFTVQVTAARSIRGGDNESAAEQLNPS